MSYFVLFKRKYQAQGKRCLKLFFRLSEVHLIVLHCTHQNIKAAGIYLNQQLFNDKPATPMCMFKMACHTTHAQLLSSFNGTIQIII